MKGTVAGEVSTNEEKIGIGDILELVVGGLAVVVEALLEAE